MPLWDDNAMRRIKDTVRRFEQSSPYPMDIVPVESLVAQLVQQQTPFHCYVHVLHGPYGKGGGNYYYGLLTEHYGEGQDVFVDRTDVPCWIRSVSHQPLILGNIYWSRAEDFLSILYGTGSGTGTGTGPAPANELPLAIVDNPCGCPNTTPTTFNGPVTFNDLVTFNDGIAYGPPEPTVNLTTDTSNLIPSDRPITNITTPAPRNVYGIKPPVGTQPNVITLDNMSGYPITFWNKSPNAPTGNRIVTSDGIPVDLPGGGKINLWYDPVLGEWVELSTTGFGTGTGTGSVPRRSGGGGSGGGTGTSKIVFVGTPGTALSNSGALTSITGTPLIGSKTTAASYWTKGKVLRLTASGLLSLSAATVTFSFKDTSNSVVFATASPGTLTITGQAWEIAAVLIYDGTSVFLEGTLTIQGGGGTLTYEQRFAGSVGPSGSPQTLDLLAQFGTASPADNLTLYAFVLESLN